MIDKCNECGEAMGEQGSHRFALSLSKYRAKSNLIEGPGIEMTSDDRLFCSHRCVALFCAPMLKSVIEEHPDILRKLIRMKKEESEDGR